MRSTTAGGTVVRLGGEPPEPAPKKRARKPAAEAEPETAAESEAAAEPKKRARKPAAKAEPELCRSVIIEGPFRKRCATDGH